jgi:hypothetical protein
MRMSPGLMRVISAISSVNDAAIAEIHGEIATAIRVVGGKLKAEREELRHVVVVDGEQARMFCGEDER